MPRYVLPTQSDDYHTQRDALREAEIALMLQRERVAELRRKLPRDGVVEEDWRFFEGPRDLATDAPIRTVGLGDLFSEPDKPLVLMQFMFGEAQSSPCPMCTGWADGYDGAMPHIEQSVNFAIVVAGDLAEFRSYARSRGWRHVRLVSSQGSTFKRQLGFESEEGGQLPGVSVFERDAQGGITHFYSGGAMQSPEHWRGMDLLSPIWHFLDLTPNGRGDFMPKTEYGS